MISEGPNPDLSADDRLTHGEEEDVDVEGLCEGEGDGDGASLASEVGLLAVDSLGRLGGRSVRVVVDVGNLKRAGTYQLSEKGAERAKRD